MPGEWPIANIEWNDKSIFFTEVSRDIENMTLCQQGNDSCPIGTEKGHRKSLILYPARATPALVLHSCREPYSRWGGAILLQGQENTGRSPWSCTACKGFSSASWRGNFFLHMQNPVLSTEGVTALTEHVKRKTLRLFCNPCCCWCWNIVVTYHYLGNYGVQHHIGTIQTKRRRGQ